MGEAHALKTYTLAEVRQHNGLDDAWLVIDNKVYDVSEFHYDHPGGEVIWVSPCCVFLRVVCWCVGVCVLWV